MAGLVAVRIDDSGAAWCLACGERVWRDEPHYGCGRDVARVVWEVVSVTTTPEDRADSAGGVTEP